MISPSPFPALTVTEPPVRPGAPLARLPKRRRRAADATEVAIRLAGKQDAAAIRELEQLDGRALPGGTHLVGTVGGVPVAALAVIDDTVVADPFEKSAPIVDLLRVRARQLRTAGVPAAA